MKKSIKRLITVFAVCAVSAFACMASGCSLTEKIKDKIEQARCEHEWNDGEVTKEATCMEKGELTKTCTLCEKVKTEEIPLIEHTEVIVAAVSATCTKDGLSSGVKCGVCDKIIVEQVKVPAIGHSEVMDEAVSPTCLTSGKTEGSHCFVCNEVLTAQKNIPATGHTVVTIEGYASTCTKTGFSNGSKCSTCGEVITAQTEIPALGHIDKNGDLVCDTCGELLEISEEVISKASFADVSSGTLMTGWYRIPVSSAGSLLGFTCVAGDVIFENGETVSEIPSGLMFDYFVQEEGLQLDIYPESIDGTYSNSNYSVIGITFRGAFFALEQMVYDGYIYFYIPAEMSCEAIVRLYDGIDEVQAGTVEGECVISCIRLDIGTGVQKVLFSVSNE